jgi:hypothetical protein
VPRQLVLGGRAGSLAGCGERDRALARQAAVETYSAAIKITQPGEIALYAKVFEHYSQRALYGERARALISQAIADRPEDPAGRLS